MRRQGLRGASIRTRQPYHDNLEQAGSLFRHAASRFLVDPDGAFDTSVLTFRGQELPSTLCSNESLEDGVLSAICDDLLTYVEPQDPSEFESTQCGWANERLIPTFVEFEATRQQCIGWGGADFSRGDHAALHVLFGAALGALTCTACVLLSARHMKRSTFLRFVQLKDDEAMLASS
jgi:hypothetical protein